MSGQRPAGETWRTEWFEVGSLPEWESSRSQAYRIWMLWNGMMWMQRHEWKNKDGSKDMQEWIPSVQAPPQSHYKKVLA